MASDRIIVETVASILEGQMEVAATLSAIAHSAQKALGSDRASCFVHDGDDLRIVAVHTTATDPAERAYLEGSVGSPFSRLPICRLLVDQDEPVLAVENVAADTRIDPRLAARLGSGAFVGVRLEHPTIAVNGRPILLGTLFMSFRSPQHFPENALVAARTLGGLAALAVANARLHTATRASLASAEARAALDPLTGLANHRTFHEALRDHVARAQRGNHPLSLVLLDLDHFKQVNDTNGHQMGDRVLIEVAARLRLAAREGDLLARTGGEEFGWILPDTDAQGAVLAAERARSLIADEIEGLGFLSASAGVCDLDAAGSSERLFELADGALYWAKAHGRDVAVRYSPEVVTDLSAGERAERLDRVRAVAGLRALARAVDAKDRSTRRHSERVAHLAVQLATASGWPVTRCALLHEAGLLHDVGKIGVPDAVLFKPGRLSPAEYEQVKQHAAIGANIAAEVLGAEQVSWVRHHHEKWDGSGYPDGLPGAETPDGAILLAVADAWDVMTSTRSYKAPLSQEDAIAECRRQSGHQFAPDAVVALERLFRAGALERPDQGALAAAAAGSDDDEVAPTGFDQACRQALDELRAGMGWQQAFLTRIIGNEIEIVAVSGSGIVSTGERMARGDAFCDRMIRGVAPPAHGRLSDPDSGYADMAARAELAVESYSGHPIVLPDGSVFGTLCVIDRTPRQIAEPGRQLGDALAQLLAWEANGQRIATALGRARVGLGS